MLYTNHSPMAPLGIRTTIRLHPPTPFGKPSIGLGNPWAAFLTASRTGSCPVHRQAGSLKDKLIGVRRKQIRARPLKPRVLLRAGFLLAASESARVLASELPHCFGSLFFLSPLPVCCLVER